MISKDLFKRMEDHYLAAMYDLEDTYIEHIGKVFEELRNLNRRRKKFPLEGDDMIVKFIDPVTLDPVYVTADYIRKDDDGNICVESSLGYRRKFGELSADEMSRIINSISNCYFNEEDNQEAN